MTNQRKNDTALLQGFYYYLGLVLSKLGSGGLNILSFTIVAASVSVLDFADYATAVAIVSILSAPAEASEYTYIRVFEKVSVLGKIYITALVLRIKILFSGILLFSVALILIIHGHFYAFSERFITILILVIVFSIGSNFVGTFTSALVVHGRQRALSVINLIIAATSLLSSLLITPLGGKIAIYLSLQVSAQIVLLLYVSNVYRKTIKKYVVLSIAHTTHMTGHRRLYGNLFYSSFFPVSATGLLSVIKNNFIILIIGTRGDAPILASFAIAKRIYDFFHKGMSGLLDQLFPVISRFEIERPSEAESGILRLFGIRIIAGLLIAGGLIMFFKASSIGDKITNLSIVAIVSLNFFITYFVTISTFVASKYQPKYILLSSIFTTLVFVFIPYIAANWFIDLMASVLSLLVASIISSLPLGYWAYKQMKYNRVFAVFLSTNILFLIAGFGIAAGFFHFDR
ncbi:MAG TPA: hypothetical protein DIS62_00590 [Candidatus Kerfeldbacteria bacterium]|nr:hypothetical protein [Candidatus Kerfeldbacteria bacterium]